MSLFKLPWMSDDEINDLEEQQMMCRIAFKGGDYPYLAPFRYIKMNDTLYFHFTDYGKKMRFLSNDERACIQIESYKPDLSDYKFVSYRGRLHRVKEEDERRKAIALFRETGEKELSTKFLAAHGFDPEKGWDQFSEEKDLVIVKLVDISERVGLKSP
ncbi:pyridoxamine 5'-phosphate oxidase family protein [Candidatus Bathyarchaeota archaeon]|nr:pyridoxamine 5'-phosphate oxidase family protein [Candidatus Bathyarchaeota archaeon]